MIKAQYDVFILTIKYYLYNNLKLKFIASHAYYEK